METDRITPRVSFVIPAYNEENYISDCIQSIKDQKTDFPYEIIVVNNDSSDKTAEIAEKAGAKVVFEGKKGLAFARQKGLETVKGEILIYLDADTRLTDGWMNTMVSYLDNHPDVVALSCHSHFYESRFIDDIGNFLFQIILVPATLFFLRLFGKSDLMIGFAMVIRTQALKNSGGINTNFVFYGEDTMLAHQLHSQGKVRFFSRLFVRSSARRYRKHGIFYTAFLYWVSALFILFGNLKAAESFSKKYS